MAYPVVTFQPKTFDQTHPLLAALSRMQQITGQAQQLHSQSLKDRLAQEIEPYNIERAQSVARMNALREKFPLLGKGGAAGQIGAEMYLHSLSPNESQMGTSASDTPDLPPQMIRRPDLIAATPVNTAQTGVPTNPLQQKTDYASRLKSMIDKEQAKSAALAQYYQQRNNAFNYLNMPKNEQENTLAQAKAFGYPDAQNLLMQGYTLQDLASAKGYDSNDQSKWPLPTPAPSKDVVTARQNANISAAAVDALQSDVAEGLGPYAKNIEGYSLKQIGDFLKGKPSDQVVKFIAARALAPDVNIKRLQQLGFNSKAFATLKETLDRNLMNVKIPGVTLTPDQFKKAQEIIQRGLDKAQKASNLAMYGRYKKGSLPSIYDEPEAAPGTSKYHKMTTQEIINRLKELG